MMKRVIPAFIPVFLILAACETTSVPQSTVPPGTYGVPSTPDVSSSPIAPASPTATGATAAAVEDPVLGSAPDTNIPTALAPCKGEPVQAYVGTPVAQASAQLPGLSRIITPNSVVTQDYRPERLNVYVDETGNIERLICG